MHRPPMPAENSRNPVRDHTDCCPRIRMLRDTSPPFPLAANAHRGFTLLELLIVVAIIAVLTSLVVIGAASAKGKAWRVQCMNNLHQIGIGFMIYAQENNAYPADFVDFGNSITKYS